MADELSLDTQQVDTVTALITVTGELELANCATVREAVVGLLAQSVTRLAVDLSGLSFIDSSGVGVIIGALKRVRERNGAFALVCSNPSIMRVFEITGLTEVFSFYSTPEEALQALAKGDPS